VKMISPRLDCIARNAKCHVELAVSIGRRNPPRSAATTRGTPDRTCCLTGLSGSYAPTSTRERGWREDIAAIRSGTNGRITGSSFDAATTTTTAIGSAAKFCW
jgi:hypothetical protein